MNSQILIDFEKKEYKKNIIQKDLKLWIIQILNELKMKKKSFSLLFTDFDTIKKLNNRYRKKNKITDVLSFSQIEGELFNDSDFLGDIVICIPQAKKQAKELNHSFNSEINFLVLHGILHLAGYDHESDEGKMNIIEKRIYKKLTGEILVDI
jgi:probable rRNA maturation factor